MKYLLRLDVRFGAIDDAKAREEVQELVRALPELAMWKLSAKHELEAKLQRLEPNSQPYSITLS